MLIKNRISRSSLHNANLNFITPWNLNVSNSEKVQLSISIFVKKRLQRTKDFEISKFLFRVEICTSELVSFWSTIVCSDVFDDIRQFCVIEQKRKIIFFAEINTLFSNYWIIKQVFEIQWYFRFRTTVWLSYLQFVRVYFHRE